LLAFVPNNRNNSGQEKKVYAMETVEKRILERIRCAKKGSAFSAKGFVDLASYEAANPCVAKFY